MDTHAPRNIRDIAHLYLSRRRGGVRRLAVVAADRECFPGLHVANLALALAQDGHRVRIVEESGLVMNAGCFLALPPQVYAAPAPRRPEGAVRAAGGVDIRFSPEPLPDVDDGTGVVEIVHGPPLDADSGGFLDAWSAGDVVVIARTPDALPAAGHPWYLEVGAASESVPGHVRRAGRIDRWERSLPDALPAVLRDPQSRLARQYRDAARRVLSPHVERRTHVDADATRRPDARARRVGTARRGD